LNVDATIRIEQTSFSNALVMLLDDVSNLCAIAHATVIKSGRIQLPPALLQQRIQ
jgi:hypothetical protein